ncbi:MAG TPA: hypothetical protein PKD83_07685 [Ignavibacteria bacterium]|nr:hypothetical protein [Ignavibacteria bacterium]
MLKSSLLEIIRTFSKQELIKFEDFVRSPYFNKKENVVKLFLAIKKHAPDFTSNDLEKEKAWVKVFPDQKYNYGIMKNLIHDLGKLSESFLSEEVYNKYEVRKSIDYFSAIFFRGIPNIFLNKLESAEKSLNKIYETGNYKSVSDYYETQRELNELKANFLHYNNYKEKKKTELTLLSEYQIFGFLVRFMKLFHKIMVNNIDVNHPIDKNIVFLFLKELDENNSLNILLEYAKTFSPKNYPVLKCYTSMYKALISNENTEYYYKFKNDLSEYSGSFSNEEVKEIYTCLLTCLTNLKVTTADFYTEYFSVIQLGFKNKVMLNSDGTITFQGFLSIVNVSCGANETEFAEDFINNYKSKLPPDMREDVYNYSMAQLNFTKKNYTESLEFLIRIQNEPYFLKFSIKNMQLSIYYELNDRISFDYAMDSFKHFIRKNKLENESRVITLAKYCDYIKMLFKLREKSDDYELSILKKDIEENKVTNKRWLFEKVADLKKRK